MGPASSMAMSVRSAAGSSRQNTSSFASAPQASRVSPLAVHTHHTCASIGHAIQVHLRMQRSTENTKRSAIDTHYTACLALQCLHIDCNLYMCTTITLAAQATRSGLARAPA